MISPIQQIKDKLDIAEVIGSYIKLEKAGRNLKARCPFHNEKTPSFSVSPERQFFYCFGCQAKGDIFTFVEKFEGLDFSGALKLLADKAGVELKSFSGSEAKSKENKDKKEKLFEIMEEATIFFHENLAENNEEAREAREYLQKRGISEESVQNWRIGLAKEEWRGAHDKLLALNFKREEILEAGVVKKVDGEEKYYDTFRNRVMFPIFDPSGRVIAFSGRILHDKDGTPKYINSPETELFRKSEVLYGFNFARGEIRRLDYAVLVEGQMDLVLSHQAGVKNCVASSGTALTEQHLNRIKKISNRIIVGFDSDEAGEKAGKRACELALSLGMEAKIASLPQGEDPASIIKNDPEKWKEYLRDSSDIIEFALNQAIKRHKIGIKLAKAVIDSVLPYLSLIKNEILRSEYVSMINRKTGIPESSILAELGKLKNVGNVDKTNSVIEPLGFSPEEMIAGLIIWQNKPEITEKFEAILGKQVLAEIIENSRFDKDTLVFEMENKFAGLDIDEVVEEKLKIIEGKILKTRLEELSRSLDNVPIESKNERDKIELEIKEISNKLAKN